MPNKQPSTASELYGEGIPLVKRLRRSTQSIAADDDVTPPTIVRQDSRQLQLQLRHGEELFNALRDYINEAGHTLCEELFQHPPKKTSPEYHRAISRPMDLAIIHQRYKDGEYADCDKLLCDVQLMATNARLFYKEDSEVYQGARSIWKMLAEIRIRQLDEPEGSSCRSRDSSPTPSTRSLRSNSPSRSLRSGERGSPVSDLQSGPVQLLEDLLSSVLTAVSDDGRSISQWFKVSPPKELHPEYYACIEEPMDLRTMASKIRCRSYKSLDDMESDFHLLCNNAGAFNEPQSVAAKDATILSKVFSRRKSELLQMGKRPLPKKSVEKNAALVDSLLSLSFGMLEICSLTEDANDASIMDGSLMAQLYCFLRLWRETGKGEPYFNSFIRLPDRRVFPDYYEETIRPVSFYTINRNIKEGLYGSLAMLLLDFCLMARNAMNCYAGESLVHQKAVRLKSLAIRKATELCPFLQSCFAEGGTPRPSIQRSIPIPSLDDSPVSTEAGKCLSKSVDKPSDANSQSDTLEGKVLEYRSKLMRIYFAVANYVDPSGRRLSVAFMDKPSKKKYPDYYQVIPEPIDLRTIRSTIEADRYASSNSMAADFDLLFENAKHYNEDGSIIYQDATTLSNVFAEALATVCPKNIELPKGQSSRLKRGCTYKRERVSCRKRSGSYSSDSSSKTLSKKGKNDERDAKLWQVYNHIKDFADSKGRVLSTIFIKLPSRMEYPDYYEVIKKPIDMQKIHSRISSNHYENLDALVADIALMFDNACKYNDPESQIYKDALMLQRLLLLKKSELQADEPKVIDVQLWVQEMIANIFLTVCNLQDEDGRGLADSLYELAAGSGQQGNIFTLDQIKKNVDKKRYRRLDRFQEDMFALFRSIRENFPPDSQVFEDSVELQACFIRTRNELTKEGDTFYSPAFSYGEKDLNTEVQEQKAASTYKEYRNPPEVPEVKLCQDGQEIASVIVGDVVYKVGDFVYVKPVEAGLQPHIMCLKRMWKTGETFEEVLAYGNWFYRPSETFHLATRKFLDHEVFVTDFFDKIDTQRIVGKCCVMFVKNFFKYRPVGFMDEDVYVCESKYLGRVKHFKKLKTWEGNDAESGLMFEERPVPIAAVRKPFTFTSKEATCKESQPNAGDADSDIKPLMPILEMERSELILRSDSAAKTIEYEQACCNSLWVKLGDCVYLPPCEPKPNILRVERIWKSNDQLWVSGVPFVFPCQVEHEPTRLFYRNEVFAVEDRKEYPVSKISGLCSVLSAKSYSTYRLAEIPEEHVYLCDSKAVPVDDAKLMVPENHEGKFRFKNIRFVNDVLEDEVYYFEKPLLAAKEPSPFLMERVITLDNASDEVTQNPEAEHPEFKMLKEMHFTPKLTARSKSGYILFSAVVRKRIMAENPDCSFGDISKIVGSEWKKLSDEEKKRYEEEAQRIADQRAKADMAAGSRLQLLPGQTRVYCCRWRECDYQFETVDQLNDHITAAHTSQIGKVGDDQYVCLWLTCSKYKKEGKPFPSLPRLHRHIKEKHLPSSVKCMYPQNRSKHYVPLPVPPCADGQPSRLPVQPADEQQPPFASIGTIPPPARFPKASQEQVSQVCFPQPTTSQTQLAAPPQFLYDVQGNVYASRPSGQSVAMYQLPSNAQMTAPPVSSVCTPVSSMKPSPASMPPLLPGAVAQSNFGLNALVNPGRTIVRSAVAQAADDVEVDAPARPQQVLFSEKYLKYLERKRRELQSEAPSSSQPSKRSGNKCAELIINAYNSLFCKDSADISKGLHDAMRQYLS